MADAPTLPIRVTPELLSDAALYTGIAVALAIVAFIAPRAKRRGLVALAAFALVMLAGLAALAQYGAVLRGTSHDVVREALLALLAVAVIRASVVFVARIVCGRLRVPQILIDVVFALGLIAYAIYRLDAVGVNLAGIVTTSAIVTGAIAFSAGETLANLWAGLSLQLENTLRIGDWVRVGDRIGQVVSIRWRSMAIATHYNETIVVPNSMLMKDRVVVIGRAGEAHALYRCTVPFRVDYDCPPASVIDVVTDALVRAELPNVARSPAPACMCVAFEDSGILFHALYHPLDVSDLPRTDSRVLVTIYASLQRAGMPIPLPQQVIEIKRRARERAEGEQASRAAVVERLELFNALVDDERAQVAAALKRLPFASDEVVFRKGDPADSLYILAQGMVRVVTEDDAGRRTTLAELTAPTYFGEMGLLMGQPRGATIVASGDVVCYRLAKESFDGILRARPEIADAMAHLLVARRAANDAVLKAQGTEMREHAGGAAELLRRIRHFFGLPARRA